MTSRHFRLFRAKMWENWTSNRIFRNCFCVSGLNLWQFWRHLTDFGEQWLSNSITASKAHFMCVVRFGGNNHTWLNWKSWQWHDRSVWTVFVGVFGNAWRFAACLVFGQSTRCLSIHFVQFVKPFVQFFPLICKSLFWSDHHVACLLICLLMSTMVADRERAADAYLNAATGCATATRHIHEPWRSWQ